MCSVAFIMIMVLIVIVLQKEFESPGHLDIEISHNNGVHTSHPKNTSSSTQLSIHKARNQEYFNDSYSSLICL